MPVTLHKQSMTLVNGAVSQRQAPSSLSILLIILLSGSTYFCSCFHFSRYACSSLFASRDAGPTDAGLPGDAKQTPLITTLYAHARNTLCAISAHQHWLKIWHRWFISTLHVYTPYISIKRY